MKRPIALGGWLISCALLLTAPAAAQENVEKEVVAEQSAEVHQRVDVLLSGIERVPTAEDWNAVGEKAVAVLVARMNDAQRKILLRGRAATALGFFPTPASSEALRAVLRNAASPSLLLRKSVQSLAKVDGGRAVDAIAPLISHRSKRVREDVVKALGAIGTLEAQATLRSRVPQESSNYLKQLIATELGRPVAKPSVVPPPAADTKVGSAQ